MSDIFNSLQFDNIDSLDNGIYITGESVYDSPERDVEAIEIAGRNGDYLLDKGRWKNIEVTYHCGCFGDDQSVFANKIRNFRNLLASKRGYQRITDTYNPAEYRMGTLITPVEVDSVSMKRAGEFDVVFNCKPQRWLTSGETEQTMSRNQTLTNPTMFDASPLLKVNGYGTVGFNGYSINIANETLGEFELYSSDKAVATSDATASVQLVKTFSLDTVNTGDTATLGKQNPSIFNVKDYVAFASGVSATSQTNSTSGASGTTKGSIGASGRLFASVSIDAFTIAIGTASTKTRTATYTIVCNDNGTTRNVVYVLSASIAYNGSNTVTYTVTRSFTSNPNSIAYGDTHLSFESGATSVVSTVSVLGNPTYIDCELGEAYMIKNGEAISLNRYIDLGSDLPTLASGNNTITFSNTITSLKIVPRWWVL